MSGGAATAVSNVGNLVSGVTRSVAAFRNVNAARRSMNAQADFIEGVAEDEAALIIQAGDQRAAAFRERALQTREEAGLVRFTGEARARDIRRSGRQLVADIQARAAARGTAVTSASPLEVAAEGAFEVERRAAIDELQSRLQEENLLRRATQEVRAGEAARVAGRIQARSTILTAKARATGIRVQAPTFNDSISALVKPLGALDSNRLTALGDIFRRSATPEETLGGDSLEDLQSQVGPL